MSVPARLGRLFRVSAAIVALLVSGDALSRGETRAVSAGPVVVAQLGLGNLLDAGKDFAVKNALSAFGTSLGGELPIVVNAADAFPTTSLDGAPFTPAGAPNIAAPLRASSDGAVALEPGDYEFPVSVFCMQAHAGSPSGHRYLVAPLHGSAADIITALDARIPSYSLDHHVLQVLSWEIQAGMAYSDMQPATRTAVDKIIPDYRSRLGGDVYERIRGRYEQTAQGIPGMPSFEEALERVGPVGRQVVALQNLRQELAQPPPTFAELARSLVPELPLGGSVSASDVTGETPWSRYSDRVLMRFTTAGNYATPGTYQVRVLPPSGSATGTSRSARVPFTNVVNNPGTGAVQPLTQTPLRGGPPAPKSSPRPSPSPSASPTIESETAALSPPNRDRKTVGVGEIVKLTFSQGEASWKMSGRYDSPVLRPSDGSIDPASGESTYYWAASVPAIETITARGPRGKASITFYVIAPSGIVNRRYLATPIFHHVNRPDSGMQVESFVTPDSVSFENIMVIEREIGAIGTGVYSVENGLGHNPNVNALPAGPVVVGLGSKMNWIDTLYTGEICTPGPFAPGALVFKIPYEYQLRRGGDFHPFATVVQAHSLHADGVTMDVTKAVATASVDVPDPTTGPVAEICP